MSYIVPWQVALARVVNMRLDHQNCDKLDDEWVIHAELRCPTTKCRVTCNSVACVHACVQDARNSSRNIVLQIHRESRGSHEKFSTADGRRRCCWRRWNRRRRRRIWQYNCPPRRYDKTSAMFTAPRASVPTCLQKRWASCPTNVMLSYKFAQCRRTCWH